MRLNSGRTATYVDIISERIDSLSAALLINIVILPESDGVNGYDFIVAPDR